MILRKCKPITNVNTAKGSCPVGQAVIAKGYNLATKYIIHVVGPVWNDGSHGEDKQLLDAYKSSLVSVIITIKH